MKPVSKSILITGVSTGIGYGAAKQFVRKDYTVFGSVRSRADADRLQAELGVNFVPLLFDVTDADAIDAAVLLLTDRLAGSGLGELINNAGIAIGGPLQHQPIAVIRQHFEMNVLGLLRVTQAFLPLLGRGKGTGIDAYEQTAYYPAMRGFLKQTQAAERRGFSVEYLGERIVQIHETPRPNIRYAIVPQKLIGWTLPRLLPARTFDWLIGRISGLTPTK